MCIRDSHTTINETVVTIYRPTRLSLGLIEATIIQSKCEFSEITITYKRVIHVGERGEIFTPLNDHVRRNFLKSNAH